MDTKGLIILKNSLVIKTFIPIYLEQALYIKLIVETSYVSQVNQTGRCLKTHINEHRNHINWNMTQHSVIIEHRINHQHEFDWENITILDKEKIKKRKDT